MSKARMPDLASNARILPLYGTIALPSLSRLPLEHHKALGADAVLVCITEEDFLYRRDNVSRVIDQVRRMDMRAIASAWGYGGLFGGEALSASSLHRELTGSSRYLNGVFTLGPEAEANRGGQRITDTPALQLKRMQATAADAGADTWFYDEMKIQRPDHERPDHVPTELFIELAEHAHSLGMRNSLCLAAPREDDVDFLATIAGSCPVDEVGFTRYYSPGSYVPEPDVYIGPLVDNLTNQLSATGRDVKVLGWAQGHDLDPAHSSLISQTAEAWKRHGADSVGIWGGFCVNETPMRVATDYGSHYDEIARVFDGRNPLG